MKKHSELKQNLLPCLRGFVINFRNEEITDLVKQIKNMQAVLNV